MLGFNDWEHVSSLHRWSSDRRFFFFASKSSSTICNASSLSCPWTRLLKLFTLSVLLLIDLVQKHPMKQRKTFPIDGRLFKFSFRLNFVLFCRRLETSGTNATLDSFTITLEPFTIVSPLCGFDLSPKTAGCAGVSIIDWCTKILSFDFGIRNFTVDCCDELS